MTEQEAIEIIWERHMDCEDYFLQFDGYPDGYDFEFDQAILIAAKALEEVQQYRKIGTVEECRDAAEKQKPVEIIRIAGKYPYKCSTCNGKLELGYRHCIKCGQLLKYPYDYMEQKGR